jgi:hypothetical protein
MPRPEQTEIRLRFVIEKPVPDVAYSLQDKKNQPVDAKRSTGAALVFNFPIRIAEGPKFYGEQVRSEGSERRFVYIATGKQSWPNGKLLEPAHEDRPPHHPRTADCQGQGRQGA